MKSKIAVTMRVSLALTTHAILATGCRGEKSIFPSLAPTKTPSRTSTLVEDRSVSLDQSLPLTHSKMSAALLNLRQLPTATSEPTYTPSLMPTMAPPSDDPFFFVPTHPANYGDDFSSTEILCNYGVESRAAYHSIEIPYFYQIKSHIDMSIDVLLHRIASSLIAALAKHILACANEEDEDIRRLVGSDGAAQARVVAAYSLPQATSKKFKVLIPPLTAHQSELKLFIDLVHFRFLPQ